MNAEQWLKKALDQAVQQLPVESFAYSFDVYANTFYIAVTPSSVYSNHQAYHQWELDTIYNFYDAYPDLGICFSDSEEYLEQGPTQVIGPLAVPPIL